MARDVELNLRSQENRLLGETRQVLETQEKQARECVTLRQEHLALQDDNFALQTGMESTQEWGYSERQEYQRLREQVEQ